SSFRLLWARRKCIAGFDAAGGEPGLEPLSALGGRTVGEFIGHHAAGGLFLKAIVTYRGCGIYCGRDVALIDQVALLGGIAPDAGEAIGLQFEKHGELIGGAGVWLLF